MSDSKYFQSPLTGQHYLVHEWDDKGDGKAVAKDKEPVEIDEIPNDKLCDYCESNLAVEWSDQGKRQCMKCSPQHDIL